MASSPCHELCLRDRRDEGAMCDRQRRAGAVSYWRDVTRMPGSKLGGSSRGARVTVPVWVTLLRATNATRGYHTDLASARLMTAWSAATRALYPSLGLPSWSVDAASLARSVSR